MKKLAVHLCLLSFQVYGISAFYNLAVGKNVAVYHADIIARNLIDGDSVYTCERFTGKNLHAEINLQKAYSIQSTRLIFSGNFSTKEARLQYYDDSDDWPYRIQEVYKNDVLHTITSDIQRTGTNITVTFWADVEFDLCEIEINGCEVDHYGEDCLPCNKSENCEVCDVNNGACYVCSENYTGPHCTLSRENVALQKKTNLYALPGFGYPLPSYRLVDGSTSESSSINISDFMPEWRKSLDIHLQTVYNIKDIRFYFNYKGTSNIRLEYIIIPTRLLTLGYYTGIEEASASLNEIVIPYQRQESYIWIDFMFSAVGLSEYPSISLREVVINACPRHHFGSPCRPCSHNCEECNAIDGSCLCQRGYTGQNCTEVCPDSTYGSNCVYTCGHCLNDICDYITGNCSLGCTNGWTTSKCNEPCSPGYYGRDCTQRCSSHCITPYLCDRYNGSCIGGCATGWTNDTCDEESIQSWTTDDDEQTYLVSETFDIQTTTSLKLTEDVSKTVTDSTQVKSTISSKVQSNKNSLHPLDTTIETELLTSPVKAKSTAEFSISASEKDSRMTKGTQTAEVLLVGSKEMTTIQHLTHDPSNSLNEKTSKSQFQTFTTTAQITSTINPSTLSTLTLKSHEETSISQSSTTTKSSSITTASNTNPKSTRAFANTSSESISAQSSTYQPATASIVSTGAKTRMNLNTKFTETGTAATSKTTTSPKQSTLTSTEYVNTDTNDTKKETLRSETISSGMIAGVSVSVVGVLLIVITIKLLVRKCKKPFEYKEFQEDVLGKWKCFDFARNSNRPRSTTDSSLPHNYDSHIQLTSFSATLESQ